MAVTESPPEVVTTDAATAVRTHPTGLAKLLGSGDHKVIGRAFIVTSFLFGLAAVVTGQLVAVENVDTSRLNVLSADTEFQVFTFHSVSATFLFLLPLMLGLAFVVVPLQVGASTIAFPRAAAASFWAWLIAGALVVTSYLINGGPGGGRARGVDLWIVALAAVLAALLLGAACLVTTVFGLRAPGMSLRRVPMFAWSMLVAGAMWLLTLPVLVGVLALMYVDHRHGRLTFGENAGCTARIVWAFRHPQVYAFAVPVLGFAGRCPRGHREDAPGVPGHGHGCDRGVRGLRFRGVPAVLGLRRRREAAGLHRDVAASPSSRSCCCSRCGPTCSVEAGSRSLPDPVRGGCGADAAGGRGRRRGRARYRRSRWPTPSGKPR